MFYKRSTKDQISFTTATSFKDVAAEWRLLLPVNHHLQCLDIQALEQTMPDDIQFKYVNIYAHGELIGVMYLQCLQFNHRHYHHGVLDKPIIRLAKNFILKKSADILICGNIFRVNFQGFYFKDKSKKEWIFDCLNLYREEMKKEKHFCGILVKDCSREFTNTQITCHGFKAFNQDLTMELSIRDNWNSFDDYLNDLSRKYRQRALKITKSTETLTLRDMSVDELISAKDRINELYLNLVRQQTLALGILNSDYFLQMKSALGDNFKVYGYYKEQQLVAFSSHIYYVPKAAMEIHYIGLDYQFNGTYNLYFNILFDGIKTAIKHRFKRIEMGRTAREAKANVGAHPVENFNYIWLQPGVTRWAMNLMGKWFENTVGDDWKKRHPFKSTPDTRANPAAAEVPHQEKVS